jgi:hypothetical protein
VGVSHCAQGKIISHPNLMPNNTFSSLTLQETHRRKHSFLTVCMSLALVFSPLCFAGCSSSDVAARQQSLTNAQSNVLANRSERIKARDQRMSDARGVWFD